MKALIQTRAVGLAMEFKKVSLIAIVAVNEGGVQQYFNYGKRSWLAQWTHDIRYANFFRSTKAAKDALRSALKDENAFLLAGAVNPSYQRRRERGKCKIAIIDIANMEIIDEREYDYEYIAPKLSDLALPKKDLPEK